MFLNDLKMMHLYNCKYTFFLIMEVFFLAFYRNKPYLCTNDGELRNLCKMLSVKLLCKQKHRYYGKDT